MDEAYYIAAQTDTGHDLVDLMRAACGKKFRTADEARAEVRRLEEGGFGPGVFKVVQLTTKGDDNNQ